MVSWFVGLGVFWCCQVVPGGSLGLTWYPQGPWTPYTPWGTRKTSIPDQRGSYHRTPYVSVCSATRLNDMLSYTSQRAQPHVSVLSHTVRLNMFSYTSECTQPCVSTTYSATQCHLSVLSQTSQCAQPKLSIIKVSSAMSAKPCLSVLSVDEVPSDDQ